jgi:hypothetical protein
MLKSASTGAHRIALAAAVLGLLGASPALAAGDSHQGGLHLLQCLHYLLVDRAAHSQFCLPSQQEPFAGLPQTGGRGTEHLILPPPKAYIVVTVSERQAAH